MILETGISFGARLCQAIGLDPKQIISMNIRIHAKEILTITTVSCLTNQQAEGLLTEIHKYNLVEKEENKINGYHLGQVIIDDFINGTDTLIQENGKD